MTKIKRGYNIGSDTDFEYLEDEIYVNSSVKQVTFPNDNVDVNTLHGEVHTYKIDVNEINNK